MKLGKWEIGKKGGDANKTTPAETPATPAATAAAPVDALAGQLLMTDKNPNLGEKTGPAVVHEHLFLSQKPLPRPATGLDANQKEDKFKKTLIPYVQTTFRGLTEYIPVILTSTTHVEMKRGSTFGIVIGEESSAATITVTLEDQFVVSDQKRCAVLIPAGNGVYKLMGVQGFGPNAPTPVDLRLFERKPEAGAETQDSKPSAKIQDHTATLYLKLGLPGNITDIKNCFKEFPEGSITFADSEFQHLQNRPGFVLNAHSQIHRSVEAGGVFGITLPSGKGANEANPPTLYITSKDRFEFSDTMISIAVILEDDGSYGAYRLVSSAAASLMMRDQLIAAEVRPKFGVVEAVESVGAQAVPTQATQTYQDPKVAGMIKSMREIPAISADYGINLEGLKETHQEISNQFEYGRFAICIENLQADLGGLIAVLTPTNRHVMSFNINPAINPTAGKVYLEMSIDSDGVGARVVTESAAKQLDILNSSGIRKNLTKQAK